MDKKILIIDEDAQFRMAVSTFLTEKGYKISEGADSDSGFKQAHADKPDLILLDLIIKAKTEGFDLAKKFRQSQETAHIPMVIVTAMGKEFDLKYSYESDNFYLPVQSVLRKPIQNDVLLQTIQKHLK